MKRIEFVAPVEAMRGNLSGTQQLLYAENDNPAYEAPNGQQYAKNYATRYIGAKRAANGLKYFAVKQKSSTTLNGLTRNQMGLIGVIAALKSSAGVNLAQLRAIWQSLKDVAGDAAADYLKTFNKFFDYHMRRMLMYKEASHTIAGPAGSVTINNPFGINNADAAVIRTELWVKFAPLFHVPAGNVLKGQNFKVDGVLFYAPSTDATGTPLVGWDELLGNNYLNPNFVASINGLASADSGASITYNGQQIYLNGEKVDDTMAVVANAKYTTIPPTE